MTQAAVTDPLSPVKSSECLYWTLSLDSSKALTMNHDICPFSANVYLFNKEVGCTRNFWHFNGYLHFKCQPACAVCSWECTHAREHWLLAGAEWLQLVVLYMWDIIVFIDPEFRFYQILSSLLLHSFICLLQPFLRTKWPHNLWSCHYTPLMKDTELWCAALLSLILSK